MTRKEMQGCSVKTDEELRDQLIVLAEEAKSIQKKMNSAIFKFSMDKLFEADLKARKRYVGFILGFDIFMKSRFK
jgi:hypothetical protein